MVATPPNTSDTEEQFDSLTGQTVDTGSLAPVPNKSTYSPTPLDVALSLDAVAEADSREVLDAAKLPPDWKQLDKAADTFAEGIKDALASTSQGTLPESVVIDDAVSTDS